MYGVRMLVLSALCWASSQAATAVELSQGDLIVLRDILDGNDGRGNKVDTGSKGGPAL